MTGIIEFIRREKPPDTIITLPNIITVTGIIVLIPYVWAIVYGWRWLILASIAWVGASDLADGFLARRLGQKTRLGEFLDPLRDRLALAAVLFNIVRLTDTVVIWYWLGLILLCEFFIILLNVLRPLRVHLAGKLRQAAHLLMAVLIILSGYFGDILAWFGFTFYFPPIFAMPVMAVASFAALVCYVRSVTRP